MISHPKCAAIATCLLALAAAGCASNEGVDPVNVVVILIDDMGWMDTGVYGSTFYDTPNIDRLAAEGARFTQFYTASSVCSPTRASIMTGKHPARLDITNWIGGEQNGLLNQAEYRRQLPESEVTIGEAFQAAGYRTGYIGKWHLGSDGYLPDSQGFAFNFAVNHAGQPASYFPPYAREQASPTDVPDLANDTGDEYLTDRLTDASLDFIESNRDAPFLLVLSHYAVHTPLQAPADEIARYEARAAALGPQTEAHYEAEREAETKLRQDHAAYAAMVESTDRSVGRILEKLTELSLDQSTMVVFLSDNGGLSTLMRRSPNQATANVPLRAGKGWLYEGGIRAPLIVRWPGVIPEGTEVSAPAVSNDIFPTLLAMAGLPGQPADHVDGRSLAPAILEGQPAVHEALFWHFPHYHGSGNRPGGAVRMGDLKLVEWFEDGAVELYDLATDLSERRDLSAERPEEVARLRRALNEWRLEVDAKMPTAR